MHNLIEAYRLSKPLLINPGVGQEIIEKYNQQYEAFFHSFKEDSKKAAASIADLLGERPRAYTDGSVGVVPIWGVIGSNLMPIEKMLGGTDVNDIAQDIAAMEADPNVKTVVFDVNSPGGTVTGVPELADQIYGMKKPTVAFARKALSAAYWAAANADRVVATTSSQVGSIGVFVAVTNTTEMNKRMGVETKLIRAGRYKAIGFPGTAMDEEEEEMLQKGVDKTHAMFKGSVMRKRKNAPMSAMEGQVFDGEDGAANGLVTGLVPSFASLMAKMKMA
jgi:signal peptide peptidase SppA